MSDDATQIDAAAPPVKFDKNGRPVSQASIDALNKHRSEAARASHATAAGERRNKKGGLAFARKCREDRKEQAKAIKLEDERTIEQTQQFIEAAENGTFQEANEWLIALWRDGVMRTAQFDATGNRTLELDHKSGKELPISRETPINSYELRVRAMSLWLDRMYGRPAQAAVVRKESTAHMTFIQTNITNYSDVTKQRNKAARKFAKATVADAPLPEPSLRLPDDEGGGPQDDRGEPAMEGGLAPWGDEDEAGEGAHDPGVPGEPDRGDQPLRVDLPQE